MIIFKSPIKLQCSELDKNRNGREPKRRQKRIEQATNYKQKKQKKESVSSKARKTDVEQATN